MSWRGQAGVRGDRARCVGSYIRQVTASGSHSQVNGASPRLPPVRYRQEDKLFVSCTVLVSI